MSLTGNLIGHIRVHRLLGKGGMGEVYEGFDDVLKRRVAIKTIKAKARRDSKSKIRFLREARALSQLQHPHICQIYNFIEQQENDYLVLEFVAGQVLHERIKSGIAKTSKLKIAEQIAEALAAAHEKGIIHRDLKPSNVMLTEGDEVKVLDFGLSRFLDIRLREGEPTVGGPAPESGEGESVLGADEDGDLSGPADRTRTITPTWEEAEAPPGPVSREPGETKRGSVMGTLLYMSPEQARGESIGSASDMYSLGLVLQELFSGELPYDEPENTELLLRRARAGETRPFVGQDSDLTRLVNRLKSTAPAARPTAVETVEHLRRIRGKPRRRMRRLAAASIATAFVLFGIKYTLDLRRERRQALQARDEATEIVNFLVDLFEVSDPGESRGRSVTVREILEKGALEVEQGLRKTPLTRARLMDTIGGVYRNLGLYADAEPLIDGAKAVREEELGVSDPLVAESLYSLAMLRERQGELAEAKQLAERSRDLRIRALGGDHPAVADNLQLIGRIIDHDGAYEECERLFRRALEIREKAYGPEHPAVAESLQSLGITCYYLSRFEESERYYRKALEIRESIQGSDHPEVGGLWQSLGALYHWLRRFDEAETAYQRALSIGEKVLGPDHPDVAGILNNLGLLEEYRNRYAEAEPYYLRALAIRLKALGEDHPAVAESCFALGALFHNAGAFDKAAPYYRRALATLEKIHGPVHAELPPIIHDLGLLYSEMGRFVDAEALHRRGLAIREEVWGARHARTALSLMSLADFLLVAGRHDEAESAYLGALEIFETELGADHVRVTGPYLGLGRICEKTGRYERAEEYYLKGLEICEKNERAGPDVKADLRFHLAILYQDRLSRPEDAERLYREALNFGEEAYGPESPEVRETIGRLARLLEGRGRSEEAARLKIRLK